MKSKKISTWNKEQTLQIKVRICEVFIKYHVNRAI